MSASAADRALWRSARSIRRYYENGGEQATVDGSLIPLIYELAPSIDFTEDEHEQLEGYPLEWNTRRKSFKAALNKFRKQAEKAGHPVPDASKDWVSFKSAIPTPPGRETRSHTAQPPDPRQSPAITISSTSGTPAPAPAVPPTPAPPTPAPPTPAPPTPAPPTPAPPTPAPPTPAPPTPTPPTPAPPTPTPAPPTPPPAPPPSTSPVPTPPQPVRPSIETTSQQQVSQLPKDIWPLFNAQVADAAALPGWRALQQECPLYGCDFADVKFRCEFRLKHEVSDNAAGLLAFASDWIRICPEALDLLDGDCSGDTSLKGLITAYRLQNPRSVPLREARDSGRSRLFSENPEQDRQERGFVNHLREPYDGWDTIKFEADPDNPERGEVEGKIKLAVGGWLDVALPSLKAETPDKERHILVRESDHPDAAKRFLETTEGRDRTFKKSADRALLRNKKRSDFKVLSHSCAEQGRHDLWPRTYTTAYLDNGDSNSSLNVWARTAWHYFGKSAVDTEINDSREEVGQERISIAK